MYWKWVGPAFAIVAGTVMFMAGVNPSDARSNIGEWTRSIAPSGDFASWVFVIIGVVMISGGAVWAYRLWLSRDSGPALDWDTPRIEVRDREFHNERVPLDGHDYVGCSFEHVTFVYEGKAAFAIMHCKLNGFTIDVSANRALEALVHFFASFGWLHPDLGILSDERGGSMTVAEVYAQGGSQRYARKPVPDTSVDQPSPEPEASP